MKLFNRAIFSLIILCNFSAFAQKFLIEGTVTDEVGKPLSLAHINFYKNEEYINSTLTDAKGYYQAYVDKTITAIKCDVPYYKKITENIEGNNIINFMLPLDQQTTKVYSLNVSGTHIYSKEELQQLKKDSIELAEKINTFETENRNMVFFAKFEMNEQYPGGDTALNEYFAKTITYPSDAKISKARGIVKVKFIIGKDGRVGNIYLIKGVNEYCDNAVINSVKKMKMWTPGLVDGISIETIKEVAVSFNIKGINPPKLSTKIKH